MQRYSLDTTKVCFINHVQIPFSSQTNVTVKLINQQIRILKELVSYGFFKKVLIILLPDFF